MQDNPPASFPIYGGPFNRVVIDCDPKDLSIYCHVTNDIKSGDLDKVPESEPVPSRSQTIRIVWIPGLIDAQVHLIGSSVLVTVADLQLETADRGFIASQNRVLVPSVLSFTRQSDGFEATIRISLAPLESRILPHNHHGYKPAQ